MSYGLTLINQPPNSGLCVACCLAMVTHQPLRAVLASVHLDVSGKLPMPYVPMREAVRFLLEHGYTYGNPFAFETDMVVEPGTNEIVGSPVPISRKCNALLTVRSKKNPGYSHMVVWDYERRKVLDPQCDQPRDLSEYQVIEWANLLAICEL